MVIFCFNYTCIFTWYGELTTIRISYTLSNCWACLGISKMHYITDFMDKTTLEI